MDEEADLLFRQLIAALREGREPVADFERTLLTPFEGDLGRLNQKATMMRELVDGYLRPNGAARRAAAATKSAAAASAPKSAIADKQPGPSPSPSAAPAEESAAAAVPGGDLDAEIELTLDLDAHIAKLTDLSTRQVVLLVLLERGDQITSEQVRARFAALGRKDTKSNVGSVLTRLKSPRRSGGIPLADHDEIAGLWSLNDAGKEVARKLARKL